MKASKVKQGSYVVLNDNVDATIYLVGSVSGFKAELFTTDTHKTHSYGWVDISLIQEPTTKQLKG